MVDYFHTWKQQLMRDESTMGRNIALRRHFNQLLQGGKARHPIVHLKQIVVSTKKGKKWKATFAVDGKPKTVHFGFRNPKDTHNDYTKHHDKKRRNRYIFRHLKDLRGDVWKPGYLAMFVLWNKPTFDKSLQDYQRRLNKYNRTGHFDIRIDGYPPVKGGSKKKV